MKYSLIENDVFHKDCIADSIKRSTLWRGDINVLKLNVRLCTGSWKD